jgi:hypothetical protein
MTRCLYVIAIRVYYPAGGIHHISKNRVRPHNDTQINNPDGKNYTLDVTNSLPSSLHMRLKIPRPDMPAVGNPPPGSTHWPTM